MKIETLAPDDPRLAGIAVPTGEICIHATGMHDDQEIAVTVTVRDDPREFSEALAAIVEAARRAWGLAEPFGRHSTIGIIL